MQSRCNKKKHESEADAILFQQDHGWLGEYSVYRCRKCGYFHVTTWTEDKLKSVLCKIIRDRDDGRSKFVRRISKRQSVHRVELGSGVFEVVFNSGKNSHSDSTRGIVSIIEIT